jgi:antitoxin CptB
VYTEGDIRRLTWQSRRGMWELDLLFVPFMEDAFRDLDLEDQERFVRLLDCEDQELFMWFMQRELPADPDHARIVEIVLTFIREQKSKKGA